MAIIRWHEDAHLFVTSRSSPGPTPNVLLNVLIAKERGSAER
jgi:hypothetical protein